MSSETIYKCDRCKKTMYGGNSLVSIVVRPYDPRLKALGGDLCEWCNKLLEKFMKGAELK